MRSQETSSGYKGMALKAIKKAKAEIGDNIRITKNGESFEGILIPRSEYADDRHIVIKITSGYNMGIQLNPETEISRIGKGSKPTFSPSPLPTQNESLPKISIISTGGTIASRVDYRTGAVRPALTASDLYGVVPELANLARVETKIVLSQFSENIIPKNWSEIAKAISQEIANGAEGVVVAHGTDTMGYTVAALSFALQNLPVPVVLVGSQRSADRPSSDAATNLIGAVTIAAKAPFSEVVLACHDTISDTTIAIHRGTKVRKCHTTRRDTFKSVNSPPLAKVEGQKIMMLTEEYTKRDRQRKLAPGFEFDDRVALVKFYPGMSPTAIDWLVEKGYKALVIEGTGLGHVGDYCYDALRNAVKRNVLVAMTSQCIWGRANMNVYDTGRDLQALGVTSLGDTLPETALVKLMWIFGQTASVGRAKELLQENIAGELSPRTLLENFGCSLGGCV